MTAVADSESQAKEIIQPDGEIEDFELLDGPATGEAKDKEASPEGNEDAGDDDEDYIEFFDTQGKRQRMEEGDLFFVEALLGQVDWGEFSEKNQRRIDKIN